MRVGAIAFLCGLFGGATALWLSGIVPQLIPQIATETEATLVTGTAAVIVALLATAIAVWGVISQRAITRRQVTFDQLARSQFDGTFQQSLRIFSREAKSEEGIARWAEKENEGTEEHQAIVAVLNDFELYSIGLQKGIIDYPLYSSLNRGHVLFSWKNAQPFVVALRARVGRQKIFYEFEELARWMDDEKMPRRSFWWTGLF